MNQLDQALQLAQQATPHCRPNPRVGCVIVSASGAVIGRGHTQPRGQAHAEIMALRDAAARGANVAGSTVYVTLEPCSHQGHTPPCCDALIAARVGRVIIALPDPNPLVAGQGIARLRAAGIAVEMADATVAHTARQINIGFFQRMQHGTPWVRLKTAASLDGASALHNGQSQWITGSAARADVQHWRARACAILTGSGTVLHDDPLLNVRLPHFQQAPEQPLQQPPQQPLHQQAPQPLLAIVDSQLRTPPSARLFSVPQRQVLIYTVANPEPANTHAQRRAALQAAGAAIITLPASASGHIDLAHLLQDLAQREINELHVEAGGTLNAALLQQGLVDEILAYIAPVLLGAGQPLAALPALQNLQQATHWHLQQVTQIGNDARLQLRRKP